MIKGLSAEDNTPLDLSQKVRGHLIRLTTRENADFWINAFLIILIAKSKLGEGSQVVIVGDTKSFSVRESPSAVADLAFQARLSVESPSTVASSLGNVVGLALASLYAGKPKGPETPKVSRARKNERAQK